MAYINGTTPGLMPKPVPVPKKTSPRKKSTPKECLCAACGGVTHPRKVSTDRLCIHCVKMFGNGHFFGRGCTDLSPDEASKKIAGAFTDRYIMILRKGTFVSTNTSQEFTVEMGDIFMVGEERRAIGDGPCSKERTWSMFTMTINVGNNHLTLFPHEFAPIDFKTVMELRKAGEIEEQFLEQGDKYGFFTPTPAVRQEIMATFGG